MEKYIFQTRDGKSRVTDTETGVTVEYVNGHFNETNTARVEPGATLPTDPGKLAETLARACKEIGDYVFNNHPETI